MFFIALPSLSKKNLKKKKKKKKKTNRGRSGRDCNVGSWDSKFQFIIDVYNVELVCTAGWWIL